MEHRLTYPRLLRHGAGGTHDRPISSKNEIPANSPDLNPVENLKSITDEVTSKESGSKTMEELKVRLHAPGVEKMSSRSRPILCRA